LEGYKKDKGGISGDANLTSNILQPAMDYKNTKTFLLNKQINKNLSKRNNKSRNESLYSAKYS
jgi:hypothetical protein